MPNQGLNLKASLESLAANAADIWCPDACGVTRSETPILALLHREAYAPTAKGTRVVLVGGTSGQEDDAELALRTLELYVGAGDGLTGSLLLSAVPCGNPDGLKLDAAPGNGSGGNPSIGYPPVGNYFDDAHNPESRYLWRWICFQGPDIVLEVRAGNSVSWEASDPASPFASALGATKLRPADSLLAALAVGKPSGLAPIPGLRLTAPPHSLAAELDQLLSTLARGSALSPSPARRVLEARHSRTPLAIARVLASVYGHQLDPVGYTQGVAISGRLRLAQLDQAGGDPVSDIVRLVEPYVSGARPMFGERPATDNLAGLIWGHELAEATGDRRYDDLIVSVADRYRPGIDGGAPPPSDPDFSNEDMFINSAMLGRAFVITGDEGYLDILTRFLLDARIQQNDGLFWHSRSYPYYWGRGNGFAALGCAETLSCLPDAHPDRDPILAMHLKHLEALRRLQRPSGMYLQVLDFPGSYQELTSTCMIGCAMARGMHRGWLDSSYMASVKLAWRGVSERIDDGGGLVDSCTDTDAQSSLRGYLDRPAVFGFDHRGGSMALWFATELEQLLREVG